MATVALIMLLKATSPVSSVAAVASSALAAAHLILNKRHQLLVSSRTIHINAVDLHDLHQQILELTDVHLLEVGLMREEHGSLVLL